MARVDTGYTDAGALDGDEKLFIIDDPAGTPVDRNTTPAAFATYIYSDIDADDIDDTSTTNKFVTAAQITKIDSVETNADVTDAANVDAAGAVMNSDTTTASMSFVVDEDDMVSDSNTKVPTQQSVKAYVDSLDADDIDDTLTTNKFATAAQLSKLDGIESGATADQTGAEIKAAYEAEADTNAFTDAEKAKLAGVETGATADQSAAEILTAIKTVDGTGSGLDADLLDGNEAAAFATAGHNHDGTYQPLDADLTALAAAGNSAVLAATTASFLSADETKLDGIETAADVTDEDNVAAAGAPIVQYYTEATAASATRPVTGGTVLWINTDGTTLPTNGDADDIVLRNSGA